MFDPYHKWLGIPAKDQPPNYYRLLHLDLYESDLDVIEGAADRAMGFIRQYQSGEHAALAAKLLNEIATARLCLMKPASKAEYDAKLKKDRAQLEQVPSTNPEDVFAVQAPEPEFESPQKFAPPPRAKKPRLKRKKSQLPSQLLIGGGIAVAVIAVFFVTRSKEGAKPDTNWAPNDTKIADVQPVAPEKTITQPFSAPTINKIAPKPATPPTTPDEQIPVAEAAGPFVNLISNVDLDRDKVVGEWKNVGSSLTSVSGSKLYLPAKIPDDYQLKMSLKRIEGTDGFSIGFAMAGQQSAVSFDSYGSNVCGLYVDGRDPNANCTTRHGALLRNDYLSTIVITVHPDHLLASVDGKTVIDWHGESRRLFWNPEHGMPNRESFSIATANATRYQLESAVMIPIKPEPPVKRRAALGREIDVMPLIDLERDKGRGDWELTKGFISSKGDGAIYLPTEVPEEYTVSATAELPAQALGHSEIAFGLVSGKSSFQVAARSGIAGLDMIDGKRWGDNETRIETAILKPGTPCRFECTVAKTGIRVEVEGKTIIHWQGDIRRLSIPGDWALADAHRLYIGSIQPCKFSDIKIGPPRPEPKLPAHPPFVIVAPVDLLALIDAPRNSLRGTWVKEGRSLRCMGDADAAKFVIPCETPSEYKLTIRVARENGGKGPLVLKLPVQLSTAEIVIDGSQSTISGIHIDGLTTEDPKNLLIRRLEALPADTPQDLVVYARRRGIKVIRGNDTLIDWQGNPDRLWQQRLWGSPSGRIVLGSWSQRFRFDKIELEPLESSPFPEPAELGIDGNLLRVVDPKRDSRSGEWKVDEKGLVSARIPNAQIRLPVVEPERYLLTADVERRTIGQAFYLGFVVGGQSCTAAIDAAECSLAGLMSLDGRSCFDLANPTRRAYATPILPTGQTITIQCFVLPDTVIVKCANREVFRWHGDARRFSPRNEFLPPNYSSEDREHLWLGSSESEFLISKLQLRPLDDDEATKLTEGFTGVFPTTIKSDVEAEIGVPFDQVTSDPLVKGETYVIVNAANGRCLSVKGVSVVSGPFAHAAGPADRWKLLQSAKDYKLVNEKSGKVLDVPGNSKDGNTQLVEYQDSNTDNERWEFLPAGKHYNIRSRSSSLFVAVAGGLKEEGSRVIQWPLLNSSDQIWRMQKVPRPIKK